MASKKITAIQQMADDLIAKNAADRQEAEAKIATAKDMIEAASETMTEAYAGTDTKAYHKAQDARREAQDTLSMYKDRLDDLNNKPLMSIGDYEAAIADTMAEMARGVQDAKEKIAGIIDTIKPIADEVHALIEQGNETLYKLQVKVYRDRDYLTANETLQRFKRKEFKDHSVEAFINELLQGYFYTEARKG